MRVLGETIVCVLSLKTGLLVKFLYIVGWWPGRAENLKQPLIVLEFFVSNIYFYMCMYLRGTHVQVRGKLGSHFSSSTMWIPGIKLKLSSLAGILAPFLAKASMGFLGKGFSPSLDHHDFPCILQSHLPVQIINSKRAWRNKIAWPTQLLKYVLWKVKMIVQYISCKHFIWFSFMRLELGSNSFQKQNECCDELSKGSWLQRQNNNNNNTKN